MVDVILNQIKRSNARLMMFVGSVQRQRGYSETAPQSPPCKGHAARFLHRSLRESNHRPSRGSQPLRHVSGKDPIHMKFK